MTIHLPTLLLLTFMAAEVLAQNEDAFYKLGPDSMRQEGVPQGKLVGPLNLPCEVFPGTSHTYWVYVPAQYDSKTTRQPNTAQGKRAQRVPPWVTSSPSDGKP